MKPDMTESFPEWRERRLKELPEQATETIPPLLFVETEVVVPTKPTCVSTICKDKHVEPDYE